MHKVGKAEKTLIQTFDIPNVFNISRTHLTLQVCAAEGDL